MIPLTILTLTQEQKEFLQEASMGTKYDVKLDIQILKYKSKYIEYGDMLCTVQFEHAGIQYECAFVFETGPARYDWVGNNAAGEDCYLRILVPEPPKLPKPKPFTSQEILDEIDAYMFNNGIAQSDIDIYLRDWKDKYLITRR